MRNSGEMRAAILSVVMGLSASSPVEAQDAPSLQGGTRVWVTTVDGREEEGSVASMSPTHLVLRIDAASRSIALADVGRIEGRDLLGNGIRNGGIAGAAALAGFGVYLSQALCEVSEGCIRHDLGPIAMLAGVGAGAGMAAGALIDYAIKGRRVLYSSAGSPIVLQVMPHWTVHSVGARVSVAWLR